MTPFGISDMAFHLPAPTVSLDELVKRRVEEGMSSDRLHRALDFTGQREMRIPDWYEDTVTMVAEATRRLLGRPAAPRPGSIRHFYCGTETAQDAAKPVSAYVQGLVEVDGQVIGPNAATFEVKHACASGTYALLGALQAVAVERMAGRDSLAVAAMGDIASYPTGTTAELTQGAGAVALLVEANPRLLNIDLGFTGFWGENVDDFFRAVPNRHASVRGRFSVDCYLRALAGAYVDYKDMVLASGLLTRPDGGHFLDVIDYAVVHAPFQSMPTRAMVDLLMRVRGCELEEAHRELERLHVNSGLRVISKTGNLYTGSLYLSLAELLTSEYERIGRDLEGKRILLASYGSGNTMVVFGGTVATGAGKIVEGMSLETLLARSRRRVSVDAYEELSRIDKFSAQEYAWVLRNRGSSLPSGAYHLSGIRDDGYRLYKMRLKGAIPS
jgi:hydroxymethylglutaryl-CoA synthase